MIKNGICFENRTNSFFVFTFKGLCGKIMDIEIINERG